MPIYQLYLESGPRRKKTMVHVLELLGCIANGPTTDAALECTSDAIRDFLFFLARHSDDVDPDAPIETEIAEHITKGVWLGNGDPSLVFQPDLAPLSMQQMEGLIQRLEWMHTELEALVGGLNQTQLDQKPVKGRSIQAILEHMLESEYAYMAAFGRIEDLPGQGSIVKKRVGDILSWTAFVRLQEVERLRSLSDEQRKQRFIHWKYTRTARKVLRRMLEHHWEHLVEIRHRLEST